MLETRNFWGGLRNLKNLGYRRLDVKFLENSKLCMLRPTQEFRRKLRESNSKIASEKVSEPLKLCIDKEKVWPFENFFRKLVSSFPFYLPRRQYNPVWNQYMVPTRIVVGVFLRFLETFSETSFPVRPQKFFCWIRRLFLEMSVGSSNKSMMAYPQ